MRHLIINSLTCVVLACSPDTDITLTEGNIDEVPAAATGSFRMGNGEIRDEIIQMMTDADIEFWIGDDGYINHYLADSEAIDKIGNEVISEYITRN